MLYDEDGRGLPIVDREVEIDGHKQPVRVKFLKKHVGKSCLMHDGSYEPKKAKVVELPGEWPCVITEDGAVWTQPFCGKPSGFTREDFIEIYNNG